MIGLPTRISNLYKRLGLTESNASSILPNARALALMNEEVSVLSGELHGLAPELFVRKIEHDVTDGGSVYLPDNCIHLLDCRFSTGQVVPQIYFRGPSMEADRHGYERRGVGEIVFHNTESSDVEIRYVATWGGLHYGTVEGVDADGNPTLSATPTLGSCDTGTGAYNDMTLFIHGGTGEGQALRIKSFDGATRVATLANSPSVTLDATSEYSILPPFPDYLHNILELGAIYRLPFPEWSGRIVPEYQRMMAMVRDWAIRIAGENASFEKAFDEVVGTQIPVNALDRQYGKIL